MRWDDLDSAHARLRESARAHWDGYLGFYSSWLGGYFREPWAMQLPLDDHGFHRGDGVFEAARMHARAYIDLRAHLERLERSAAAIGMRLPKSIDEIRTICVELARRCDADTGILRLYVTRGPGGFSPSVGEVVGHQVYAAITRLKPPVAETYERGVSAMISAVEAKEPRFARIKSCNYLQNVLMKKECLDKGFDFAISVDHEGRVCEGATENLLVVSEDGEVLIPRFDYTLAGTTVQVVMELARDLRREGRVKDVRFADLSVEDVARAREAAFVGTTLGVLPIASLDGKAIGSGNTMREITLTLNRQLMQRMATDASLRTAY